jgi:CheY-like chemotaxis protein
MGKKILVVDDDADIRESLELYLGGLYDVALADGGDEALRVLEGDTRAVVLDIRMPGLDGFAVCQHIQARYPYMPIIFYSAYHDAKDPYQLVNEYRPYAYMTKDGQGERLLEVLAGATSLYDDFLENEPLVTALRASTA